MKPFNTLAEVLEAAQEHQVTAQELLNGRSHVYGQWQDIELTDEFRDKICEEVSQLYGGRYETRRTICNILKYGRVQHWGLSRTVITNYHNNPRWYYIAGQDHPYELKQIRKQILSR